VAEKLQDLVVPNGTIAVMSSRVLFSTDYPFHRPSAAAVGQFFDAIADPSDRSKIASGNAEALFRLAWPASRSRS